MNIRSTYFPMVLFLLFIVGLSSCETRKDRTSDLKDLNDLLVRLDSAKLELKEVNIQKIQSTTALIKKDVKDLQDNYTGNITKDLALEVDRYKGNSKRFKKFDLSTIGVELEEMGFQIRNLIDLIEKKATVDINGNKIDDVYIDKAIKAETEYTLKLIQDVKEIEEREVLFFDAFNQRKPFIDSLINEMNQLEE